MIKKLSYHRNKVMQNLLIFIELKYKHHYLCIMVYFDSKLVRKQGKYIMLIKAIL